MEPQGFYPPKLIKSDIHLGYFELWERTRARLLEVNPLSPENNWIASEKKADYTLYYKSDPATGLNWSRGDTTIERSMKDIIEYINLIEKKSEWDNLFESGKTVETLSEEFFVSHQKYKPVFPTQARDFVIFVGVTFEQDRVTLVCCSVEHPEVPVAKGFTRAHFIAGGFIVESIDDNKSKVIYYSLVDPRGNIPKFVANTVSKSQAMIVVELKKRLEKK